jgi:hypothetical protein
MDWRKNDEASRTLERSKNNLVYDGSVPPVIKRMSCKMSMICSLILNTSVLDPD